MQQRTRDKGNSDATSVKQKSIYPGRLAVKGPGTRLLKAKRFVKGEERGGKEGKDALTTFQRTMKA